MLIRLIKAIYALAVIVALALLYAEMETLLRMDTRTTADDGPVQLYYVPPELDGWKPYRPDLNPKPGRLKS